MKLALIGFGNAGGKITDRFLKYDMETGRSLCRFAVAVNTAAVDLEKLTHIPEELRVLIGQTHPSSKGHGAGADPNLGAEITRNDIEELKRVLDSVPLHDIDAFLIVAGLGGGTGSGGGPVLASMLSEQYGEPVYGLGILPTEEEGGRATLNTAETIPSYVEATDGLLTFDNNAWRTGGDSVDTHFGRANDEIARRIGTLLATGEHDTELISENAMDASDINRTLALGGINTVAYAEADLDPSTQRQQGFLKRLRQSDADTNSTNSATKIHSLVRRAVNSRLTCPATVDTAERALVVVSGPPSEISQKGIDRSRQWLETKIDSPEVLAGDDPRKGSDCLSATVLLGNVTDVPRIDGLQRKAVDAKNNIEAQATDREEQIADLVTDSQDRLDPV